MTATQIEKEAIKESKRVAAVQKKLEKEMKEAAEVVVKDLKRKKAGSHSDVESDLEKKPKQKQVYTFNLGGLYQEGCC